MASSTCPKCNNHSFELEQTVPKKSSYKLYFVQCSKCGTPVGVMEFFNIGAKIEELQQNIEKKLSSLQNSDSTINNNIGTLSRQLNSIEAKLNQLSSK